MGVGFVRGERRSTISTRPDTLLNKLVEQHKPTTPASWNSVARSLHWAGYPGRSGSHCRQRCASCCIVHRGVATSYHKQVVQEDQPIKLCDAAQANTRANSPSGLATAAPPENSSTPTGHTTCCNSCTTTLQPAPNNTSRPCSALTCACCAAGHAAASRTPGVGAWVP